MLYAFISTDKENSLDKRMASRPAHVERLLALKEQGRLIIAGPHPAIDNSEPGPAGFTGSLVVAEFDNLQSAEEWARNDPYMLGGVYDSIIVKPYNKVLP
ncbi:MAG: YciI family protein [Kangiellaceae bacterium]|nr:YciI family protein [Kangiellaceae bacterium]